jgi:chromosome partitioning protein
VALRVIALVSQKGGGGKSTLLTNLAVNAWKAGKRVCILDADPQASASQWFESRGEDDSIELVQVRGDEVEKAIRTLQGFDLALIDTPARAEPINAVAAKVADYCLIPCLPSLVDMRAQKQTVDTVLSLSRRGAFVLNRVPARGQRGNDAAKGLAVFGLPVIPALIGNRNVFSDAYASGQAVCEFEPEGKGAAEIKSLWEWIARKIK